jgi:signal recognition particle-docking protein ftsY
MPAMGFFDKLKSGLKKTKESFLGTVDTILAGFGKIDEALFEELEDVLISSDFGVQTTEEILKKLRESVKTKKLTEASQIRSELQEIIAGLLDIGARGLDLDDVPAVITVIGVNGVGKTTSIGKIAHLYRNAGKKVLLAAGDTFRAAAGDQLAVWAERSGAELIRQAEGADPAAVLFDACRAAKAREADVLICDTAGRLHNKKNLMDELAKMARVVARELPDVRRETFLVLDATTGQNAVNQAKAFSEVAELTGIVLTKLDGSSKGGIIVSICNELSIPVRLVGVGEGIGDMQPFSPEDYVRALFE